MRKYLSVYFLVFFLPLSVLSGQNLPGLNLPGFNLPSLNADPKAYEFSRRAASGLSWSDLAEISLWASGVDPFSSPVRGGSSYMEIIASAVRELLSDPALPAGKREQGEYILDFMFKKFLKRYSEKQTLMNTLLSNGTYNCVSSSVLYIIFASAAGLRTEGVVTREHALVRFINGASEIDIETTNPFGFDPGNRRDFHDEFGRVTGFAYVPAGNYRDRADINSIEMISLIFSNRITDLESRNRFDEALKLALDRAALLSFSANRVYPELLVDPRRMVVDRIFNYGALLIRQGKENDALLWAEASSQYPDQRWDDFIDTAVNNLMARLIRANRNAEARAALEANAYRMSNAAYERLDLMLNNNRIAELHNAFAAAYNKRDFAAARNIIYSALEEFPGNSRFLANKELIDQALQ